MGVPWLSVEVSDSFLDLDLIQTRPGPALDTGGVVTRLSAAG